MTKLPKDIQRLVDRRTVQRARDGAVVDPVVDEASGTQWFFKFRKNSPLKHKWIFLGGPDLLNYDGGNYSTPGTAVTYPGTPVLTVPFTGVYIPGMQAYLTNNATAGTLASLMIAIDATTVIDTIQHHLALASAQSFLWRDYPVDGQELITQHQIILGYQSSVLGVTFNNRSIRLRPRRVTF